MMKRIRTSRLSIKYSLPEKCGPGHWERVYKEAIYLAAIKGKFCCQMEQALYVPQKSGRCYAEHRVDLVIGGRFVFELKTTKPSQIEQKKNCSQIWNYLDFMRSLQSRGNLLHRHFCLLKSTPTETVHVRI
jgi:GxxExxY protein